MDKAISTHHHETSRDIPTSPDLTLTEALKLHRRRRVNENKESQKNPFTTSFLVQLPLSPTSSYPRGSECQAIVDMLDSILSEDVSDSFGQEDTIEEVPRPPPRAARQ